VVFRDRLQKGQIDDVRRGNLDRADAQPQHGFQVLDGERRGEELHAHLVALVFYCGKRVCVEFQFFEHVLLRVGICLFLVLH